MFLKNYFIVYYTTLILGTFISISSNNWFTAWVGLEVNLMSMTPLILIKLNKNLSEAAIKYFLTQALASIFIISVSLSKMFFMNFWALISSSIFFLAPLLIKAGIPPFHFWFPKVAMKMFWTQCMILFTWQKVAPLLLIIFLESNKIFFFAALAALTGAFSGLNQNNLKILLTYSSISHSGWMLNSCLAGVKIWVTYFFIYSMISLSLIFSFMKNKMFKVKDFFSYSKNNLLNYSIILNFLSLGGLPPLLGFMAKISILFILMETLSFMLMALLIMSSLFSLFFYARILYNAFFIAPKKTSCKKNNFNSQMMFSFSIILNFSPMILIMAL